MTRRIRATVISASAGELCSHPGRFTDLQRRLRRQPRHNEHLLQNPAPLEPLTAKRPQAPCPEPLPRVVSVEMSRRTVHSATISPTGWTWGGNRKASSGGCRSLKKPERSSTITLHRTNLQSQQRRVGVHGYHGLAERGVVPAERAQNESERSAGDEGEAGNAVGKGAADRASHAEEDLCSGG